MSYRSLTVESSTTVSESASAASYSALEMNPLSYMHSST